LISLPIISHLSTKRAKDAASLKIALTRLKSRLVMRISISPQPRALACVGLGWYPAGKAGGVLAASVLRGESPASIPFQEVAEQKLVLNQQVASSLGIVFS
jgi:ABC-type uncharacterized transport system substrate-binding protein